MLSIADMITRIRTSTHDQQKTGYSDEDLLGYINDGVRLLRRTIIDVNPALIADAPITGTLDGTNFVKLDKTITQVISVFADNVKLRRLTRANITDESGNPHGYFVSGFNTINFYPFPDKPIDYSITVISDMQLLKLTDSSPFPNDLDDFLFEYALLRASIGNEYDMSQETNVMSQIIAQAQSVIMNMEKTNGVTVKGYWDKPYKHDDYGHGRR